jgi:GAF domain-containing protein
MSEQIADYTHLPKTEAWSRLNADVRTVLEGIDDDVAAMATISAMLYHGFGHLWAGFYRVVEPDRLLRVGPYQGSLGCLEIAFGSGVCGTAAAERRTVVVPDVNRFPGHIACDASARSEIVTPVVNGKGELTAVLDIDSEHLETFDDEDARGIETLVTWFARR